MNTPRLLDHLPASVELAAGSGKTWTLADNVRSVAGDGGRALVLTHTVAGVHAMSSKLGELDVDPDAYHVATLTSLAVELVSAYSSHAGFDVPEAVDLSRSEEYIQGAIAVLQRQHIRDVFGLSYTHLLVDEYQDCSTNQHALVRALKTAIPQAIVFGDRLQGIFGFADPIVDWDVDVLPEFPDFPMNHVPRRWQGHNEDLGAWLLSVRRQLTAGNVLDLRSGLPNGVTFLSKTAAGFELVNAARQRRGDGETVVVIAAPHLHAARAVASRLSGYGYVAMEEMGGSFMAKLLGSLAGLEPSNYATWLASTAKDCFTGYGKLDSGVMGRLAKGKPAATLKRPGLEKTLAAIDRVQSSPDLRVLAESMDAIRLAREAQLHSREAWRDMTKVIEACAIDPERDMSIELVRVRERVRYGGRQSQSRVVSRTVLIKGLEYDHVIIANAADISDACNLYVALSRARKSVTIIGPSPQITIKETPNGR
ncbi:UvrD-helicase domain-containing protein [Rhodococcus sp. NPDC003382]